MGVRSDHHEWNADQVERLKSLWGTMSAREIGNLMGFSKGSIVGKADRLKLPTINTVHKTEPDRPSFPTRDQKLIVYSSRPHVLRRSSSRKQEVKSMQHPEPESMMLITITELTDTTCHWPIGDPSDWDNFRYCGCSKEPGIQPYCQHHLEKSMKSFEAVFC